VGTLRIIGGELRGRRIAVPHGVRVRPTGDRAREALFSILGQAVSGTHVLDAYAGSGAFGFESLSRGARRATLIEADRRVLATLRASAVDLGLAERVVPHHGRVLDLLRRQAVGGPFELIFADPPYDAGEIEPFLALAAGIVTPTGQVVVERESGPEAVGEPRLEHVRTSRYGRCCLDFYRLERASDGGC
jgi:16S rRNA (guanine966-N2)-methyltransferase